MKAPERWSTVCVVAVLVLSTPVVRTNAGATGASAREIFLSTDFALIHRLDRLSAPVSSSMDALLAGRKLTDPVYFDQATQMWKPNLRDRLVFAGSSASFWFVYYELVGPKAGHHVVMLKGGADGKPQVAEHLVLKERAWSTPQLKNAIRRGEFTVIPEGQVQVCCYAVMGLSGCTPDFGLERMAITRPQPNLFR